MVKAMTHNEGEREKKMKALNEIHSQKIKALLRSIQTLKKEVQKEKHSQKDNVRAQMIERLRKDIGDHEMVIETLRKIIGDEDLIEQELMKVINKGPERMRVPTREELRMEIKKLKRRLGVKTKKAARDEEADKASEGEKENSQAAMGEVDNQSAMFGESDEKIRRLEESLAQIQTELRDKNDVILTQREEVENLKVEIRARDMNIQRQQRSISELHDEIRDLKQYETEMKQLLQKKMALEEQNQEMKTRLFDKFIDT